MYNRYIPEDMSFTRTSPQSGFLKEQPRERPRQVRLPDFLTGREGLTGLLRGLRLDKWDSGDLLLLLITLYLLVEGEDLDLVVALGLVLLMGLGEDEAAP